MRAAFAAEEPQQREYARIGACMERERRERMRPPSERADGMADAGDRVESGLFGKWSLHAADTAGQAITSSPSRKVATSGPSAATVPARSIPRIAGKG